MRGWVYRLQLLLDLASAFILRSEFHGTHDYILVSQIRDSPNLEGQVPVFISLTNRVARFFCQSQCYITTDGQSASLFWYKASMCQSQSYFTTDGLPPISSSWHRAPCESRPDFFFQLNTCSYIPYVTSSDERMGLLFTIAAGPRQRIHSQVRVPQHSWPHFTLWDSKLPQPGAQVPVFISPRNRVAQLYPQALGSLFDPFYDAQGYDGGNWNPPPHPGGPVYYALTRKLEADRI
jgi:hypothetical protein